MMMDGKLCLSTIISRAIEATILTAQQIYLESQAVKNQNSIMYREVQIENVEQTYLSVHRAE